MWQEIQLVNDKTGSHTPPYIPLSGKGFPGSLTSHMGFPGGSDN